MTDHSTYKQILKSTSLFGGVQVIQILINLIRAKFVAIFLGTAGLGVSSLLGSSITIIQLVFGMGLNFSAVREISQAQATEDRYKLARSITVFFRWLLFSALMGALVLVVIAPWLSDFSFGNKDYTWEFVWLSIVVAINIFGTGYTSLLQGTRRLKDMAKASVIGSILSLLISIPIYYYWRTQGIVPALILVTLTTFIINFYFARKIKLEKVNIGAREVIKEGREMFKLGSSRMITDLFGILAAFLIIVYIKKNGSLSDVGLYQAGISISNQYVGIIFTAIAVDYFPRLSAVSTDVTKVRDLVNQQSEIMLLIITPLLITMILTAPLLIRILLTAEFLPITSFIRLIAIGVFFQAAKQSMDLISFAKGDTQTFLMLAIAGSCSLLFSSIIGYTINGLNGTAAMFILHSILCFVMIYSVAYKKYNFLISESFKKIFIISTCSIGLVYALLTLIPTVTGYVLSCLLLCSSGAYSIYKLDKLIGLKESYNNFINRF